jgi:rhodanese-related sulfurtransferase
MPRERFIEMMTHDLPPRPEYFRRDVDVNRHGAAPLEVLPPLAALTPAEVEARQEAGAAVLDTRPAMPYAGGHIPGSVQIGLGGQFASWAGTVIGLDRDVILVGEDDRADEEARTRLARVGIERVIGHLAGGIAEWARAGLPLAQTQQISVQELGERRGEFSIVDVRRSPEWEQGHIEGALNRPLDGLRDSVQTLDRERPLAIHCKSGYRSMIACSLLEAQGFRKVANVLGGFDAWTAAAEPSAG